LVTLLLCSLDYWVGGEGRTGQGSIYVGVT